MFFGTSSSSASDSAITPEASLKEGQEFFRHFSVAREGKVATDNPAGATSLQDTAYAATSLAVATEQVVVGLLSVQVLSNVEGFIILLFGG